jgi:hypothetical protein
MKSARVVVLSEGLGNRRDLNFYSPEAIQSLARILDGRQAFMDHPTKGEEQDRPERSVRDLIGFYSDARAVQGPNGRWRCEANLNFDDSQTGQLAFDKVKTGLEFARKFPGQEYAGISVNGGGITEPATVEGERVNKVTEIKEIFSADLVTRPARGGKFLAITSEAKRECRSRQLTPFRTLTPLREAQRPRRQTGMLIRGGEGTIVKSPRRVRRSLEEIERRASALTRSARVLLAQHGYQGVSTWPRYRVFVEAVKLARRLKRPAIRAFREAYGKPRTRSRTAIGTFREVLRGRG